MKSASWIGAAAVVCSAALSYSVQSPSSQVFAPSIYRGNRSRRSVALTFDDGPSPGTVDILSCLQEANARATFFQCGLNVSRHPEIARQVVDAGHEIGNHTFSHRRLSPRLGWQLNLLSPDEIHHELSRTQDVIRTVTGLVPRWFRAPYGMRWIGLRAAQRHLDLHGAYWTVIGHDWEWDAERVAEHVLARVQPGAIVCLHDGRDTRQNPDISATRLALPLIIRGLTALGYRFETLSEIFRS